MVAVEGDGDGGAEGDRVAVTAFGVEVGDSR